MVVGGQCGWGIARSVFVLPVSIIPCYMGEGGGGVAWEISCATHWAEGEERRMDLWDSHFTCISHTFVWFFPGVCDIGESPTWP